jgi:hypothetical protein|eukprot:CAMPEP_0174368772 /NCGR_PEP_ID=MMETSP0811_2-20130205/90101_1 /TAXON_ID=73025 ORGANISM="Eutreptiella gymnastica-like, Strain CCMP1594" /NCGR_SAMPLE_ID=MMETSP0811_2 /ASSEMBLY_ACC=CAM_ASM_000667 /LENGTH=63 /DNA_ID=CAMNT_0015512533 /DNA_START=200 /DNA_END=391 /DNA_ORIENTATION=-
MIRDFQANSGSDSAGSSDIDADSSSDSGSDSHFRDNSGELGAPSSSNCAVDVAWAMADRGLGP